MMKKTMMKTMTTMMKKNDEIDEQDLEESAEQKATRRATIAAEILSADVWSLTDAVMASTENLNRLWEILDDKEPLSISFVNIFYENYGAFVGYEM